MRLVVLILLALAGVARAADWSGAVPSAVTADPPRDPAHPARSSQVLIPSGGTEMNGLIYIAAGAGPHPTVILLHGFPGNEQNLDLAQAIRRAGWNVLTLHYRGSWGSPGTFSIAHAIEDGDAAVTFLRRPEVAASYQVDRERLVLGGHSMGGFVSAAHARHDPALLGTFLIDAWNTGADGVKFAALGKQARHAEALKQIDDLGHSLQGADEDSTVAELIAHKADWNFQNWAPQLTARPLLVVGAAYANGAENHRLAAAVAAAGGKVEDYTLDSDHSFQDHRIALESIVVTWLNGLARN
jgi:pimeloyl-ACP methyl ester carboxylesterase